MTWRQILEGLASLPAALKDIRALQRVGSVSIATLTDDDVIIVETDDSLSQKSRENLSDLVHKIWPNNRVVIWDSGLKMRVVPSVGSGQAGVH